MFVSSMQSCSNRQQALRGPIPCNRLQPERSRRRKLSRFESGDKSSTSVSFSETLSRLVMVERLSSCEIRVPSSSRLFNSRRGVKSRRSSFPIFVSHNFKFLSLGRCEKTLREQTSSSATKIVVVLINCAGSYGLNPCRLMSSWIDFSVSLSSSKNLITSSI